MLHSWVQMDKVVYVALLDHLETRSWSLCVWVDRMENLLFSWLYSLCSLLCSLLALVPECFSFVFWFQVGCPGLETASSSSFCTDREPHCSPQTTWPLTWPSLTPASQCSDTPEASSRSSTSSRAVTTSSPLSGLARYQTPDPHNNHQKHIWNRTEMHPTLTWLQPEPHLKKHLILIQTQKLRYNQDTMEIQYTWLISKTHQKTPETHRRITRGT